MTAKAQKLARLRAAVVKAACNWAEESTRESRYGRGNSTDAQHQLLCMTEALLAERGVEPFPYNHAFNLKHAPLTQKKPR